MSVQSLAVDRFAGLNLTDDPQEVGLGGAIDLLNVDMTARGRVRTRPGYTLKTALSGAPEVRNAAGFLSADETRDQLVVATQNKVYAVNSSYAIQALAATFGGGWAGDLAGGLARFGTPSAEYVYFTNADAGGNIGRWDGTAFTTLAAAPGARHLAVQASDNRLVAAGGYRVMFSDAGDGDTFGANNYVDLTPGDGEWVYGVCAWRDMVFVFKRSKFFVFYGTSSDAEGNPVFNYRTVNGWGKYPDAKGGIVATPDGVVFCDNRGVWLTTGGPPTRLSDRLGQLYGLGAGNSWQGSTTPPRNAWCVQGDRVFFTGAGHEVYVLDLVTREWTYWELAETASMIFAHSFGGRTVLPQLHAATTNSIDSRLNLLSTTDTADNGTAIATRYRTGFADLGAEIVPKVVREILIDGQGTVSVSTAVDDGSLGSGTSVALGSSSMNTGRYRVASRGGNVSVQIAAASGQWSASRVALNLAQQGVPGEDHG